MAAGSRGGRREGRARERAPGLVWRAGGRASGWLRAAGPLLCDGETRALAEKTNSSAPIGRGFVSCKQCARRSPRYRPVPPPTATYL